MEQALIVIAALLVNALLAGPRRWLDRLGVNALLHKPASILRVLERKLNREHRSATERQIRGVIVIIMALIVSILAGIILSGVFVATSRFFEIILLALLLPVRPGWDVAATIRNALLQDKLEQARDVLDGTIWRHHARLDMHAVARAAVELLAVNFSEKILAPIMCYMIAGLPGLFFCVLTTIMYETLATSGGEFGKPAQLVYRLLHWLPARLAACVWIVVALFSPVENIPGLARTIWEYMTHQPPQELQLACVATVQQVSLGGPPSPYVESAWFGGGSAQLGPKQVKTAQYSYALQHVVLVMVLGLLI